jgi:hypothetical protein
MAILMPIAAAAAVVVVVVIKQNKNMGQRWNDID